MIFKLSEVIKLGVFVTFVPLTGPRFEPHQLKRRSSILLVGAVFEVVAATSTPATLFPLKSLLLTYIVFVAIDTKEPLN